MSEPLLLLAAGCLVGLTPSFASFALSPDVVLFLFLPALLYWEALTSSVREIRTNFRSIALQSTSWPPLSPSPLQLTRWATAGPSPSCSAPSWLPPTPRPSPPRPCPAAS
ncbi:hypothetical protein ACFWWB_38930 [Streptomyces sp. NPDC058690]|uniref:hypothetical protein n=1 Tax=Streptomyces sp. NPDC058690 TaxID=3346600 RepID=UPI0036613E0C